MKKLRMNPEIYSFLVNTTEVAKSQGVHIKLDPWKCSDEGVSINVDAKVGEYTSRLCNMVYDRDSNKINLTKRKVLGYFNQNTLCQVDPCRPEAFIQIVTLLFNKGILVSKAHLNYLRTRLGYLAYSASITKTRATGGNKAYVVLWQTQIRAAISDLTK